MLPEKRRPHPIVDLHQQIVGIAQQHPYATDDPPQSRQEAREVALLEQLSITTALKKIRRKMASRCPLGAAPEVNPIVAGLGSCTSTTARNP